MAFIRLFLFDKVTPAQAGVQLLRQAMGFSQRSNDEICRLQKSALLVSFTVLLACLLTGCGSLLLESTKSDQLSDTLLSSSERQPNPYWQKQRRVDELTRERYAKAISALQQGELSSAEEQFVQLSREQPKLSGPWVNMGIVHYQRGEWQQAEDDWIKAIKLNRYNFDAYTNLALLMREKGEFDKAESIYKTALAKWPDNAEMHCNLGILYDLYQGQQELALQEYLLCEQLSDNPSRRLRGWIVDLQRRTSTLARK